MRQRNSACLIEASTAVDIDLGIEFFAGLKKDDHEPRPPQPEPIDKARIIGNRFIMRRIIRALDAGAGSRDEKRHHRIFRQFRAAQHEQLGSRARIMVIYSNHKSEAAAALPPRMSAR